MDFRPLTHLQVAGVTAYYDTLNWHYAYVARDDLGHTVLEVLTCDDGDRTSHPGATVRLPAGAPVELRAQLDGTAARFAYRTDPGGRWTELGVELDATILSDEYAGEKTPPDGRDASPAFTGAFLGLWVQDIGQDGGYADFDHATYRVDGS
jgi:xylan 1,4-beta-xylosidase